MNEREIGINFETGEVLVEGKPVMTTGELLFLLDSANQYNSFAPVKQSEEFMAQLRERIGLGFTQEQLEQIKSFYSGEGEFDPEED